MKIRIQKISSFYALRFLTFLRDIFSNFIHFEVVGWLLEHLQNNIDFWPCWIRKRICISPEIIQDSTCRDRYGLDNDSPKLVGDLAEAHSYSYMSAHMHEAITPLFAPEHEKYLCYLPFFSLLFASNWLCICKFEVMWLWWIIVTPGNHCLTSMRDLWFSFERYFWYIHIGIMQEQCHLLLLIVLHSKSIACIISYKKLFILCNSWKTKVYTPL